MFYSMSLTLGSLGFLMIRPRAVDLGKEHHKGEVPSTSNGEVRVDMTTWFVMMLTLIACLRLCLAGFSIAELPYSPSNSRFVRNESLRSAHTQGENYPPPPGRGSIYIHYLELCAEDLCFLFHCVFIQSCISVWTYSSPWELFILLLQLYFWPSGALSGGLLCPLVAPPFYFRYFIFWHYETLQAHCVYSPSQP